MSRMNIRGATIFFVVMCLAATAPVQGWERAANGNEPGIPDDWVAKAQAEIINSEYEISWAQSPADGGDACYQAPNRAQNLRFLFRDDGALHVIDRMIGARRWNASFRPREISRDNERTAVGRARFDFEKNTVSYSFHGLRQNLVNNDEGMLQEFIFENAPEGSGRLTLSVGIDGDVTVHRDTLGNLELRFEGDAVLVIRSVEAADSLGKHLDVRLSVPVVGGAYELVIADEEAIFPITVKTLLSLPSSPNWTTVGEADYISHGFSVATAGDLNCDGYSDVVIGAPGFTVGGNVVAGRAYVYFGGAAGPPTTPSWSVTGAGPWWELGRAVATAGDVNGDGCSDLVIGIPGWENSGSGVTEGAVYLFHGGYGGISTTPDATRTDPHGQHNGGYGFAVATAGDVNGDGYSDVLVGQPFYDSGFADEGWVGLYLGTSGGLSNTAAINYVGAEAGSQLGYSVATAGDVNGDGYADIMLGEPNWSSANNTDCGLVRVCLGSSTGPQSPCHFLFSSQDEAHLGTSVSTAGDINGDGYSDVIIGSPDYDTLVENEGAVFVYYGGSTFDNTFEWFAFGEVEDGGFGSSVGYAGDVNSDGYADVVIGEPGFSGTQNQEGRALLWYGAATGPAIGTPDNADWKINSGLAASRLGTSVATAGDVNGDGYSDILVGAPYQTDPGVAFAFYGGPDTLAATAHWGVESDWADSRLGFVVAPAGDVNGDGYADFLVGAPYYDSSHDAEGAVLLFHGSSTGPAYVQDWFAKGDQPGANFGWAVGTAGDVNGDGYSDVIIGAPYYTYSAVDCGGIFVYYGSSGGMGGDGNPTNADWSATGTLGGAHLGYSASTAGDVNGDGYADVAGGAPNWSDSSHADEGGVFVWHGSASGLGASGTPFNADWSDEGDAVNRILGTSIGSAGDVNGDGYADLIAGGFDLAVVWHGSASGLNSSGVDWAKAQGNGSFLFGRSVAGAGDINGDGYSDVVVGAPTYTQSYSGEGAAWAYCGGVSGVASSACWWDTGFKENAFFGMSVASAGDLNGDGYADLTIGAPGWADSHPNEGQARVYFGSSLGPISFNDGDWTVDSNSSDDVMGSSVAGVGDVNGDGYGDLLVGRSGYTNGQSLEGRIDLFYGNGRPGVPVRPRQLVPGGTSPIAPQGRSNSETEFSVRLLARNPAGGRGIYRLTTEVKAAGTVFDATAMSTTPEQTATSVGGILVDHNQSGLTQDTAYHWRVRVVNPPLTSPFGPPESRWYHMPSNGWNEADLRTAGEAAPQPDLIFMDGFESGDTSAWN